MTLELADLEAAMGAVSALVVAMALVATALAAMAAVSTRTAPGQYTQQGTSGREDHGDRQQSPIRLAGTGSLSTQRKYRHRCTSGHRCSERQEPATQAIASLARAVAATATMVTVLVTAARAAQLEACPT
jgi:hypothetical protein